MTEDGGSEGGRVAADELERIIEAAAKLGVEVNEADATQWLAAMAAGQALSGDLAVDAQAGVFGHRITLLDFDPAVLERYRSLAEIVEIPNRPQVETAVSLSGSAAQSRIQLFPGDADFFERVNIRAETREEACKILADVIREKALSRFKGENYELVEIKWGTFVEEVMRRGEKLRAGMYISWEPDEVKAGELEVLSLSGEPRKITWDYGCQQPGWCKLDWVIVEPRQGTVVHASNMLDVTWERADGELVPLDGFLDPYFQEVYLDAESIPLFTKVVKQVSPDAVHRYVEQLKKEVAKYSRRDPKNFGKVAKRLYNIFRLTGHWAEAAFVRELFDEPAALLYQVGSVLDTIDEALESGVADDRDALVDQVDRLIRSVIRVCEGTAEERIVDSLLRLRDDLTGRRDLGDRRADLLRESNRIVGELVNAYFEERLLLMPEVRTYIESLGAA